MKKTKKSSRRNKQSPQKSNYRLEPGEPVSEGIKRIAIEQVDTALRLLTTPGIEKDKAVHNIRRSFKRIRAVLRLLRDEIGEDVYKQENIRYRDAARRLSALRSSAVLDDTLDVLTTHYAGQVSPSLFDNVSSNLVAIHRQTKQKGSKKIFAEVTEVVSVGRERLLHLQLQIEDYSALDASIRRVYGRGFQSMETAYADPTSEHFHEWRKRVKYLFFQMSILWPLWPGPMNALADELDHLAETLGLEHDLAELEAILATQPSLCQDTAQQTNLLRLIANYRTELQGKAHVIGLRAYAERPKAFEARLGRYWVAWQEEEQERSRESVSE